MNSLSRKELEYIASQGETSDNSLSREELEYIASQEESGWQKSKDIYHDVVGTGESFAHSGLEFLDTLASPVRKAMEGVIGRPIGLLSDIKEPYKPKTSVGKVLNKGASYAGSMATGAGIGKAMTLPAALTPLTTSLPAMGTAVKEGLSKAGQFLGSPSSKKELAQLGTLGGASGLAAGALEEGLSVPPLISDIIASVGVPGGKYLYDYKKAALKKPYLRNYEKNTAEKIKNRLSEEELAQLESSLKNYHSPVEGYEASTAEIGQHPYLSQLERANLGHTSLKDLQTRGQETLKKEFETLSPQGATLEDFQEHLLHKNRSLGEKANEEALRKITQEEKKLLKEQQKAQKAHEKSEMNLSQKVSPYLSQETRESTGSALQKGINKVLKSNEEMRTKASSPLYDAMRLEKEGLEVWNAKDYVTHLVNDIGVADPVKRKFLSYLKDLQANNASPQSRKLYDEVINEYGNVNKKALNQILEDLNISAPLPHASQVDQVLRKIGKDMKLAKKSGQEDVHYYLSEFKKSLEKDVEHVPSLLEARSVYSDLSKPVSAIKEDRALGKAVEKDIYSKDFKAAPAELPKLFFKGDKAIENARNLVKVLKDDKEALQQLKTHLYEDFIKNVTDHNGMVSPAKVKTYVKNNPAASIIDPQFASNVDKIKKAQQQFDFTKTKLNKTNKQSVKPYSPLKEKDYLGKEERAFRSILGPQFEGIDTSNVISKLMKSSDSNRILDILLKHANDTPLAKEGLKEGVVNYLANKINIYSPTATDVKFLDSKMDFFKKIFSKEEMTKLNNIMDVSKMKHKTTALGSLKDSGTSSNEALKKEITSNIVKGGLSAFPGGKYLSKGWDYYKKGSEFKNQEAMEKFLTDPQYAQELLGRSRSYQDYTKKKAAIANPLKKQVGRNLFASDYPLKLMN